MKKVAKSSKKVADVELDKDIQAAIERQNREGYNEYITSRENARARRKKEQKEEKFLSVLIVIFIIIVVIMTLVLNYKLTEKARKNCIQMGHSENYCYEKL